MMRDRSLQVPLALGALLLGVIGRLVIGMEDRDAVPDRVNEVPAVERSRGERVRTTGQDVRPERAALRETSLERAADESVNEIAVTEASECDGDGPSPVLARIMEDRYSIYADHGLIEEYRHLHDALRPRPLVSPSARRVASGDDLPVMAETRAESHARVPLRNLRRPSALQTGAFELFGWADRDQFEFVTGWQLPTHRSSPIQAAQIMAAARGYLPRSISNRARVEREYTPELAARACDLVIDANVRRIELTHEMWRLIDQAVTSGRAREVSPGETCVVLVRNASVFVIPAGAEPEIDRVRADRLRLQLEARAAATHALTR